MDDQDKLYGKCILSIRFRNHGEYLKWKRVFGMGRKWEFMIDHYPAIMQSEYIFHKAVDVEMMAKQIVALLQQGFDVYSAKWQLKEYQSQLED